MQYPEKIQGAWLLATVFVFFGDWCTADDTVEEVVVSVPRTIIETELLDYGIVRVRYEGPIFTSTLGFDEVSFVEQTSKVPNEANGFGVRLVIQATPRHLIGVAEVWSHPALQKIRTGQRLEHTSLLHTLDPPNAYTFYFPSNEYETTPAGDWTLKLFLIDEAGPGARNVEFEDDPVRFSANGVKPFFEYAFEVQPTTAQ